MFAATASAVLHLALVGGPTPYELALYEAQAHRQPLLVLVGADWCPGCVTMKRSVLPRLASRGELSGVSFAAIDSDADRALAGQLMRGGSIPQLIAYSQRPDGEWHREQLTGAASEAAVQALIARARAAQGNVASD